MPSQFKHDKQAVRVSIAASTDPANPGSWTVSNTLRLESLQMTSGSEPAEATFSQYKAPGSGSKQSAPVPPNTGSVKTGDGTDGTMWTGSGFDKFSLVKVEIEEYGNTGNYVSVFLGVILNIGYDFSSNRLFATAKDYRHFLNCIPLYGRKCWKPGSGSGDDFFLKETRITFNADGMPDRSQTGVRGDTGSLDNGVFIRPNYNRNQISGEPLDALLPFADFWTLGHVMAYLGSTYVHATPSALDHLNIQDFITWPDVTETGDNSWLYDSDETHDTAVKDLAVTGLSLGEALDAILKRAGRYEWTMVPDGDKCEIQLFHVGEGLGTLDFEWGAIGSTVDESQPDILGGNLSRDYEPYRNRGFALGRRNVYEVTLDTTASPPTLKEGWDTTLNSTVAGLLNTKDQTALDRKYENVFLRFVPPDDLDWGTVFFGGAESEYLDREAFNALLTEATIPADSGNAERRIQLKPLLWRKRKASGADWELHPAKISLSVERGVLGVRLSNNAREFPGAQGEAWTPEDVSGSVALPYTWNGLTTGADIHDFRVTIAIEADQCVSDTEDINSSGSGEPDMEYFLDGGNAFRSAYRSNAYYMEDGGEFVQDDGSISATPWGSVAPYLFIDGEKPLIDALYSRLQTRNVPRIAGTLLLSGIRINDLPVGYSIGQITVSGTGARQTMDINCAIRSAFFDWRADTTRITIDGR